MRGQPLPVLTYDAPVLVRRTGRFVAAVLAYLLASYALALVLLAARVATGRFEGGELLGALFAPHLIASWLFSRVRLYSSVWPQGREVVYLLAFAAAFAVAYLWLRRRRWVRQVP